MVHLSSLSWIHFYQLSFITYDRIESVTITTITCIPMYHTAFRTSPVIHTDMETAQSKRIPITIIVTWLIIIHPQFLKRCPKTWSSYLITDKKRYRTNGI